MGKLSDFTLWVLLGLAIILVPIACGSASLPNDGKDSSPSDMTHI
jgi:hypothetical protein